MPSTIQDAKPSCPAGGLWYECPSGSKFVGCCTMDPCHGGCSQTNLRAASFNPSYQGLFPDQKCTAGSFYTCAKTSPPFLGCCLSNPCIAGKCSSSDLAAAILFNNTAEASSSIFTLSSPATSTVASSTFSSSTSTLLSSISPSVSSTAIHSGTSIHLSTGALAGIIAGGVLLLLALTALLVVLCQRGSRPRIEEPNAELLASKTRIIESSEGSFQPAYPIPTVSVQDTPYSPPQHSFQPSTVSSPALSSNSKDSELLRGSSQKTSSLGAPVSERPPELEGASSPASEGLSELDGSSSVDYTPMTYQNGGLDPTMALRQESYLQGTKYMPYRPA